MTLPQSRISYDNLLVFLLGLTSDFVSSFVQGGCNITTIKISDPFYYAKKKVKKAKKKSTKEIPSAGFVVVRYVNNVLRVLLVESKSHTLGFPKGKQEAEDEGDLRRTASRELEEETGLTRADIAVYARERFDVYKTKDDGKIKLNVFYVARLTNEYAKVEPMDGEHGKEEVLSAKWYDVDKLKDLEKGMLGLGVSEVLDKVVLWEKIYKGY